METSQVQNQPDQSVRKVDFEMIKTRLNELKVKFVPALKDSKNRKIIILAGALIIIILLLLIVGLFAKNKGKIVVSTPTPIQTGQAETKPETILDRLNKLENEIKGTNFENKSYLPPEVDLDIRFKL